MRVSVYDYDSETKLNTIGHAEFSFSNLVMGPNSTYKAVLIDNNKDNGSIVAGHKERGQVIVHGEAVKDSNNEFYFKACASVVKKGWCCCKSDCPYIMIEKVLKDEKEEKKK